MSGLTPILDTLLHQVLGRRVDLQQQDQQALQKPVNGVEAVRALKAVADATTAVGKPATDLSSQKVSGQTGTATNLQSLNANAQPSARFSDTAQLIAKLMTNAPTERAIKPAQALATTPEQARDVPQLAAKLSQSVRESGLFYESHLSKWLNGKLSSAHLQREPQMLLTRGAQVPLDHHGDSRSRPGHGLPQGAGGGDPAPPPGATLKALASLLATGKLPVADAAMERVATHVDNSSSAVTTRAENAPLPAGVEDKLFSVVRQQLEVLGSQHLQWQGELMSGQPVKIEIEAEPRYGEEEGTTEEGSQGNWSSSFTIALPMLGTIRFQVRRVAEQLAVEVFPQQKSTAMLLKASRDQTAQQLQGRSGAATAITVHEGAG